MSPEPQVADRIRGLSIVLDVEQQDAGVTFKCRLSSLLHPSDSLDDVWMWGAFSELHVHECKKCVQMCVACKCGAVAVWCSQAAPDVPWQSTVQKLFIS